MGQPEDDFLILRRPESDFNLVFDLVAWLNSRKSQFDVLVYFSNDHQGRLLVRFSAEGLETQESIAQLREKLSNMADGYISRALENRH